MSKDDAKYVTDRSVIRNKKLKLDFTNSYFSLTIQLQMQVRKYSDLVLRNY